MKSIVTIKNWKITDEYGYYHLVGEAINHPNLGSQRITTSRLLKVDFVKMKAETLNTIYKLERQ